MKFLSARLALAPLLALALCGASATASNTWYVDAHATPPGLGTLASPYTSLQHAVDAPATVNGDTILVAPGDYAGNLRLDTYITVRSTGGPLATIVRGNVPGPVVSLLVGCDCQSPLPLLDGFTITGVSGPPGTPAVYSYDGTIEHCIVTGNTGNGYFGYACAYDGYLRDTTIAGNDNGARSEPIAIALVERVALQNTNVNWVNGGLSSIADSVGVGLPATGGNLDAEPGFWNYARGDYHLRPGSPCHRPGGDVGALAYDASYAFGPLYTCDGKLNSHACVPMIAVSGLASVGGASSCLVTASLVVPGRVAVLLYSADGAPPLPFQGSALCAGANFKRAGMQLSAGAGTCGGTLAFDFNSRVRGGLDPALVPGAIVCAQWWYRDRFDPAGYFSGLTNAALFGIAP